MGRCPVILLDEPSTGMDPAARHALWGVVRGELVGGGDRFDPGDGDGDGFERAPRAAVLTTHSMEEAEAVCSRVGVLQAGRLRCVGGVQRLRARHAGGYVLEVRCAPGREAETAARVAAAAPGAAPRGGGAGAGRLGFALPRAGLDLPALIEALEAAAEGGDVEEWAVGEATLETVFLGLAARE